MNMNKEQYKKQIDNIFDSFKYRISDILPSEWSEKHRYVTSDVSNRPGPFRYDDYTPYTKEIVDILHLASGTHTVVIMKAGQIGFSEGVIVNGILYIMSENPGLIMLTAGNDTLRDKMINTRIDPAIDSSGLRYIIGSNVQKKRNQRTGDTVKTKEFPGGNLIAFGAQNLESNMRQNPAQFIFCDDWDEAPRVTKEGGSTFDLVQRRAGTYGNDRRVFFISTPAREQTSNIYPLYLQGNQKKFHLPCPRCGEFIPLEWLAKDANNNTIYINEKPCGVIFDIANHQVIKKSIRYRCQKCGGEFTEREKYKILKLGKWIATAESYTEGYQSYLINALIAPAGQMNWYDFAVQFQRAHPRGGRPNPGQLHTFNNLVLGLPWREQGKKINVNRLSSRARNYQHGVIPNKLSLDDGNGPIIAVTCAADLNGYIEDGRLDYEICAWSMAGPSYSIAHESIGTFQRSKSMRGKAHDEFLKKEDKRIKWTYYSGIENSVWEKFKDVLLTPLKTDDGNEEMIWLTVVDSGQFTDEVFQFVEQSLNNGINVYAIKGLQEFKKRAEDADNQYYKYGRSHESSFLCDTNLIKDDFASAIQSKWPGKGIQPLRYCNFPRPDGKYYTESSYYSQLTSEERKEEKNDIGQVVKYYWDKKSSASVNHLFDCRIYNMAARDILYREYCKNEKLEVSWNIFCNSVIQ